MRNGFEINQLITRLAENLGSLGAVVLGIVGLVVMLLAWRSGVKLRRYLDGIRVEDGEVTRELTAEERMEIARRLVWKRGRWFWPLVGAGVVLAAAALLIVWQLGLL